MSEQLQNPTIAAQSKVTTIRIIYILFIVSYFTGGLAALVGVIMAYVNRSSATAFEKEHLNYLIKLFWISFVLVIVALLTWVFVIGMIVGLAWFIWSLIKIIKGMTRLGEGKLPKA
ncbi:MAG: DUF4870 family protein [Silvania sp.]|jgi:uncharacterized membrane protein|uniref:DUF4870 domain-containing protein n=1 Tax=Silvania hatchlandensis TaxID=2926469 RepID=A0A9J6Q882_9ENTR|nr:hypothetical protein [Silvania hatchlandensis]MCU6664597.1 hypothetical protein [Silvania hatchlandensis]